MATGTCRNKTSVDCLVLCHNKQNRKVSAKSVTMRATALCKNFSGYRELHLNNKTDKVRETRQDGTKKKGVVDMELVCIWGSVVICNPSPIPTPKEPAHFCLSQGTEKV